MRLADVDPTIRQDMRYAGAANFLGRPAKGYDAPACILTKQAADALSKVQKTLASQNLTLIVFDCYRPARAVKDFVGWVRQGKSKDPLWHPNVRRSDLIKQGYIASRSGHSRGSTVDLAIAPTDGRRATNSGLRRKSRHARFRHRLRLPRPEKRDRLHTALSGSCREPQTPR